MQVLGKKVLAKIEILPEKTQSGLFLHPASQKETDRAEVVSVGKDVMDVTLGDTILYKLGEGEQITIDNEKYIVLEEEKVMAIFEGESNV